METHPLYEIRHFCSKSENSAIYSCEKFQYDIVDKKTGKPIMTFYYTENGDSDGWEKSGAIKVEFSGDGKSVIVTNHDGKIETHGLPRAGLSKALSKSKLKNSDRKGKNNLCQKN